MKKFKDHLATFTFLLIAFIFLSGCESPEQKKEVKLNVKIDSNKIGERISDALLGVEFHSPINWSVMNSEISEKNESMLRKRRIKERYLYKPNYIFFNDSTRCFLSVGMVSDNLGQSRNDSILLNYISMLEDKYNGNEYSEEIIETNNIVFHQFYIEKPKIISYKLVFQNIDGNLIQFEYTVPTRYYANEKNAVGSSIASIKPSKNN